MWRLGCRLPRSYIACAEQLITGGGVACKAWLISRLVGRRVIFASVLLCFRAQCDFSDMSPVTWPVIRRRYVQKLASTAAVGRGLYRALQSPIEHEHMPVFVRPVVVARAAAAGIVDRSIQVSPVLYGGGGGSRRLLGISDIAM